MLHHRAFGRDLDTLVVAVVDNRRPILSLMRAMLAAIGTGRIETYESPTEALDAMTKTMPDLVIASAAMQPLTGAQLVRAMRRSANGVLALVPAMIMSVRAKPAVVEEALRAGLVPELASYGEIRREVAYDRGCRVDFLLSGGGRPDCFVEVKNVHLRRTLGAEFPDTATARGVRHLGALARQVAAGARAVVLYVVQRTDCADFRLAADLDPGYAAAAGVARAAGVETLCRACAISVDEIRLAGALPVVL